MGYRRALKQLVHSVADVCMGVTRWVKVKWGSRPKGFEKIPLWMLGIVFMGSAASGFYWLKGAERVFMPLADYTNTHPVSYQVLVLWAFVAMFAFQGVFFKGLAWHTGRIFWKRVWS
ncbi:MAG: hypothetical protein PCALPYG88_5745 [uncultured Paraburkholderia sp.]|uniref:hypothetical protein n=1 Tax=uncultured Paraburkholderia sp. TaxID=1822466 RepID=UPI002596BF6E|nr:hypothetical protein [uncultured Paraburkholderia sp.]CAH2902082.1 MAG: hypothetical protein PCALPYG08_5799 [uncultured Paraburkholderia sp.]CAH2936561.1 MAG: hypothetical protein PCALPYG88_5745 [uncultured Paraburkholderia sp.]